MAYKQRIRSVYEDLSPSFRVLARFVLDSPYEASFLNGTEVAKHLGFDAATVVRFAQRIGYRGYPELLVQLRKEVLRRILYSPDDEGPKDAAGAAGATVRAEKAAIGALLESLDDAVITDIVAQIGEADRIVVCGDGVNGFAARLFATRLEAMGRPAIAATGDAHLLANALRQLSQESVVFVLAEGTRTHLLPRAARIAKRQGAYVVAVVSGEDAAHWHQPDAVIAMPGAGSAGGASISATLVLTTALAQALWAQNEFDAGTADGVVDGLARLYEHRSARVILEDIAFADVA